MADIPSPEPPPERPAPPAPLRFALSFIEGRALIGFDERRLAPWLRVHDFRMEIPEVRFPFDVSGGAERFRNRRCHLRGLAFEVDENGFVAWLRERLEGHLAPLADLEIAFGHGFVELAGTVPAGDHDSSGRPSGAADRRVPFSARLGIDADEDAAFLLVLHDLRLYASAALPAPGVGLALLKTLAEAGLPVGVVPPAAVRLDPVPQLLRTLLPRQGWKLPAADGLRLIGADLRPGGARLDFGTATLAAGTAAPGRGLLSTLEGARAFTEAEAAVAEGDWPAARAAWWEAAGPVPDHPFAAERLLSLMVSDPARRDAAADLAETLLARDPSDVAALWVRALVPRRGGAGTAFLRLAEAARDAGERLGARLSAEAAGRAADAAGDADTARRGWELALEVEPSHGPALEALMELHLRDGDVTAAMRTGERLLDAVTASRRAPVHVALGRLLNRHAPEAAARARLHFDAALRLDPAWVEAWEGLAEACAADEPLRAVRALERARTLVLEAGDRERAAELGRRVGTLWEERLGHPENALLRYRESLEISPGDPSTLLAVGRLALRLGRLDEAESRLEAALRRAEANVLPSLGAEAHLGLAEVARRRDDRSGEAAHLASAERADEPDDARRERLSVLADALEAMRALAPRAQVLADLAAVTSDPEAAADHLAASAALLLESGGASDIARARLTEARRLHPEGLRPLEVLADLETRQGSADAQAAALEALARRRPEGPGRAEAWMALGAVLEGQGALERALGAFREAAQVPTESRADAALACLRVARAWNRDRPLADALCAAAEVSSPEDAASLRLEEAALRQHRLEDPEGAERALEAARQGRPDDPRVLWEAGRLALSRGDARRAHGLFLDLEGVGGPSAAQVDPLTAARTLGEAAAAAGEDFSAAVHLARAVELDPSDRDGYLRADEVLARLARPVERARLAGVVAERHAERSELEEASRLWVLASDLVEGTDPVQARQATERALDVWCPASTVRNALERRAEGAADPAEWPAEAFAMAERLARLGEADSDAHAVLRAAEILAAGDPTDPSARLADALHRLEPPDPRRIELLQLAVRLDPSRSDLRKQLAATLAETDPAEALGHYEVLLAAGQADLRSEVHGELRRRAADLAVRTGDPGRARHHLGIQVALCPGDRESLAQYAGLLREADAPETLSEVLLQLAAVAPDRESAVGALVEAADLARNLLDRPALARESLEAAIEQSPDHRGALLRLSDLLPADDLEGLARVHRRLAEGAEGPAAAAHRTAEGRALLGLGRAEAATEAFEAALALDDEDREAAEGLAEAAWCRGDLLAFVEALPRAARLALAEKTPDGPVRAVVAAVLLLDQGGEPTEARRLLDQALEEDRDLPGEWRVEALERRRALRDPVDRRGEVEDLRRLLGLREVLPPNRRVALHRRRARLQEAYDPEGAREDWAEVHRLEPADPEPIAALLKIAEAAGDAAAEAALWRTEAERRLRTQDPEGAAEAWLARADRLMRGLKDPVAGERALERAIELSARGPVAIAALGRLRAQLFESGRWDASLRLVLREIELTPAEGLQRLLDAAREAARLGRKGTAVYLLRAAHVLAPNDPAVAGGLLEALYLAGAQAEAEGPARSIAALPTESLSNALDGGGQEARRLRWMAASVLAETDRESVVGVLEALMEEAPAWSPPHDLYLSLPGVGPTEKSARLERHWKTLRHPGHRREVASRLADLAAVSGDPRAEAKWLEEAGDEDPALLGRRLEAWRRAGEVEGYVRTAETLLRRSDPAQRPPLLAEAARTLAETLGSLEHAAALLEGTDAPETTHLWEARLDVASRRGDAEARLEALRALARLADEDGRLDLAADRHAEVARLTAELGHPEAAQGEWLEALSRNPPNALVREAASWAEEVGVPVLEATALRLLARAEPQESTFHLTRLADVLQQGLGQVAEAEEALREALALDAASRPPFDALIAMLAAQGRHPALAEACRSRAAVVENEAGALLLEAARHALASGRVDEATRDLEQAASVDPESFLRGDGARRLDEARARSGRHRERAQVRLEAAEGAPADEAARLRREAGILLLDEEGDVTAGLAALASAHRGGDREAGHRLERALRESRDWAGLAELHRQLSELSGSPGERADHLLQAGEAWEAAGQSEAAADCFDAAFDEAPEDSRTVEARLARVAEDPSATVTTLVRHLDSASETAPDRPRRLAALARAQERIGAPVEALETWEAVLGLVEDDVEALVEAGRLAAEAGADRARPYDRRLDQLATVGGAVPRPALLAAWIRLGTSALEEGRLEEAVFRLEAALDAGEAAAEPLARAAQLARRPDLVARACEVLAETTSGAAQVRAFEEAAEAWERVGAFDTALARWHQAFELDPSSQIACRALEAAALGRGDPAGRLRILERHAGSLTDPIARHAALLEVIEAAGRLGETVRRDRAAREAFALAGDDSETARAALPALRQGAPHDLGRALRIIAESAPQEARPDLLAEAAEAFDQAGDAEAAASCRRAGREAAEHLRSPGDDSRTVEETEGARPDPALMEPPAFLARFESGRQALLESRPLEALAALRASVELNPAFVPAWREAAEAARVLGDEEAQREGLEGALAALPDDAGEERFEILVRLATLAHRGLRTETAVRRYEEALALQPDSPSILEPLARLYEDGGRLEDSRSVWERLARLRTGPEAAQAHLRVARILADGMGRADAALPHAEAATREAPDEVAGWRQYLELAAPRGDPQPVVACVAALTRLGRSELVTPWALEAGRALEAAADDPAAAAEWLLVGARSQPGNREVAGEAAAALIRGGRSDTALALLDEVASTTGEPADLRAAAEAALWAGDPRGWIQRLSDGLGADLPASSQSCLLRGLAGAAARWPGAADPETLLDRAAALDPDGRPLHADRARVQEVAGHSEAARESWLAAARLDPGDRRARLGVARTAGATPRAELAADAAAWLGGETLDAAALDPAHRRLPEALLWRLAFPPADGPVARFLAAMAPGLEPLFPSDTARLGVDPARPPGPEADALAARLERWTTALDGRPIRLLVGTRLGSASWLENTRPLSWVVGPEVLEAPVAVQDQLLVRAIVLGRLGYALPGKFSGNDLQVLVRLALSFFNGAVPVPIPAEKVRQYHAAMGRLVTPERRERLAGLAATAAGALADLDPAALAPALRRTADRVALLMSGDLPQTLEAVLRQERRWALVGAGRAEQVRAHPALGALLSFALDDALDAWWRAVRRTDD